MIYVVATLKIRAGMREACIAAARAAIEGTRAEEGCLFYDLHASTTDPDALVFVEKWTDRAALTRHFGMPHLKEWRARAAEFVVERQVEIITPADVETL